MKPIRISDVTLREAAADTQHPISFKEKIEIVKQLDRLNIDVIESFPITNGKTDILFLHTVSPLIKNAVLSCPIDLNEDSAEETFAAISQAAHPRLVIRVPVSTVQMEYMCHRKPDKVLELIAALTRKCASLAGDVEVAMLDATRAEEDFLVSAIRYAIDNGAKVITLCDSAGELLPFEFECFVRRMNERVPQLRDVTLSVECSNALHMAAACAISCIGAGVGEIKTTTEGRACPALRSIGHVFKSKGVMLGVESRLNMTAMDNALSKLRFVSDARHGDHTPFDGGMSSEYTNIRLANTDDIQTVGRVIAQMGYDLSEEDLKKVYDAFCRLAAKKEVGARELDAIIATHAMQVPPTYKLRSYVINNGNIITPTAMVELEKNGEVLQGLCSGDGPVDAAFLAIEQVVGHHFELDDFQIQAITEGREALGSSIVKLRSGGKLYSGKGVSTDIIGASINAYINALNKICFEEGTV